VAGALKKLLPDKNCSILVIGCGNANLSSDMHQAGWKNQV
jgi:hypothetical protein